MNNTYKIKIESPILRPGLTIETECSEKYAKEVTLKLLDVAREVNDNGSTRATGEVATHPIPLKKIADDPITYKAETELFSISLLLNEFDVPVKYGQTLSDRIRSAFEQYTVVAKAWQDAQQKLERQAAEKIVYCEKRDPRGSTN